LLPGGAAGGPPSSPSARSDNGLTRVDLPTARARFSPPTPRRPSASLPVAGFQPVALLL